MQQSLSPMANLSNKALWRSRRIYFVGALGKVVEWYDFALYGILAQLFATQFFSHISHSFALIMAYLIFFISYLARPLGGLFYGLIGDHWGRKPSLLLSILLMTLCMFITAGLPAWDKIGGWAPLLLILFRVAQGISAGGETVGSLVYVLESVNRRGFYGGLIWSMGGIGMLIAMVTTVLLMHGLGMAQFSSWGWRLCYLLGGIAGLIIFFLRTFIPESIEFKQAQLSTQQQHKEMIAAVPFKKALLQHWSTILMIIGLLAISSTIDAAIFPYFPQYMHQYFSISLITGWTLNAIIACVGITGVITFGALSDRVGSKRLLVIAASCFLLFSYPLLSLLSIGKWQVAMLILFCFTVILAMYAGPLPALLVNFLPLRVRYTAFALGYNAAYALFAGSAPLICSLLARLSPLAPAFYFIGLAALSLSLLYFVTRHETGGIQPIEPPEHNKPLSLTG